jgi:hypothetical protein
MRPSGLGSVALAFLTGSILLATLVSFSFKTPSGPGEHGIELLSSGKAHAKHAAHKGKGSKYSRELAELSKEADPSRKSALAVIDAMAKRADRGAGITKTSSGETDNDELGRLAKAHGIGKLLCMI